MEYRKAIIHQCVCGQEEDTEVLLPCLEPAEEPEAVGLWGQRHLRYIRQYEPKRYESLQAGGGLTPYLKNSDRQAERILSTTVAAMAKADGTDEALKAADMMKWVGLMNNYRHCAEEIVYAEIIYV